MSGLTLCAIRNDCPDRYVDQLKENFSGLASEILLFDGYYQLAENVVRRHPVKNDWYAVFYADEWIDNNLRIGITSVLLNRQVPFDCFSFFKKEDCFGRMPKRTIAPRLFRSNVELHYGGLRPYRSNVKIERLLDGWVKSR